MFALLLCKCLVEVVVQFLLRMEGGCFQNQESRRVFVDVQSNRKRHKEIRIIILIGGTVESPNNLKFEQFMAMFRSSLPIIVRQYPSNHTKLKFLHSFWMMFWFSILELPDMMSERTNKKSSPLPFFYISESFQPTFCLFGHFYKKEVFSQVVQVFLENLTACSGFPWWNCNSGNPPHIPMALPSCNKCCLKTLETEWGV